LNGIHSINLFNVFRENIAEGFYFKGGNNHWNDRGQKLAAKETALYLIHNSMVEKNTQASNRK